LRQDYFWNAEAVVIQKETKKMSLTVVGWLIVQSKCPKGEGGEGRGAK